MLNEILPFALPINKIAIAGTCLWALALYIACSSLRHWITEQLDRWFHFAESLYLPQDELQRTRKSRESQNAFYASIFSIFPFLAAGILCDYGVDLSLGRSWSISLGILACMGCAVYELGRRSGEF
ncbi:hypothetical protein K4A83_14510 [Spirulina subsalsa FACHB-351]|uniref:Uncharacterized protein n=1 Tax=Spirulina subsalsa FACHB-351 TaxID=234711 RepID=A0ABT3L7J4_9CYAN|nr:hypothetical protein [Spirulina subsalsa]MCW6037476.1 hypothetical protein [Spirulina subsalsa FACHB-351]